MREMCIGGPLGRQDLPGLVARVCAVLEGVAPGEVLRCEVGSVAADAVAVDALARLALAAGRRGCQVRLAGAREELVSLVGFMGLAQTLRADPTRQGAAAGRTEGTATRSRGRT
jgi:ABC-type transporter Mla MlaB component